MSTDSNMTVINEEYERVLKNPDNMIMSEGLMERMTAFSTHENEESFPTSADSHDLYISFSNGVMDAASISGSLHSLQQSSKNDMSMSFEISSITQDVLKKLYVALSKSTKSNLKVTGIGGFSCVDTEISQWDLTKIAPHQFLLSITFGGNNVTF